MRLKNFYVGWGLFRTLEISDAFMTQLRGHPLLSGIKVERKIRDLVNNKDPRVKVINEMRRVT